MLGSRSVGLPADVVTHAWASDSAACRSRSRMAARHRVQARSKVPQGRSGAACFRMTLLAGLEMLARLARDLLLGDGWTPRWTRHSV